MEPRFVTGEPALRIGSTVVVADLHIGIEHRYRRKGITVPSQSGKLLERLEGLVKKARAKRIVILGDVKHKVPGTSFQEEREIPAFFRRLLEAAEVEVCPGNHDDGLGNLLPEGAALHPATGFRLGKAWLCHGHAWPPEEFLECETIVLGHNHAGFEFRDRLGYRWVEPVIIRGEFDRDRLGERYPGLPESLPEMILLPPVSELTGFVGLNSRRVTEKGKGPGPLFRASEREKAGLYMLDGTYLGKLGEV